MRANRAWLRVGLAWIACMTTLHGGCAAQRRPEVVGTFVGRPVACSELRGFAAEQQAIAPVAAVPELRPTDLFEAFVVARMLEAEARRGGLERTPAFARRFPPLKHALLRESLEAELDADVALPEPEAAPLDPTAGAEFADDGADGFRARLIYRAVGPGAAPGAVRAAAAELDAVQGRFLSGVPFAELAAALSEHDSAGRGGVVTPGELAALSPDLERRATRLEPGEVSEVIRLPNGVALVLREAGRASSPVLRSSDPAPMLEDRAQRAADRRAGRREQLLAEARQRFAVRFVAGSLAEVGPEYAGVPVAYIDDEPVSLASLGLEDRPPLLREAVEDAVDEALLVRLAESEATPAQRAAIEAVRRHLLAELAMEDLLRQRLLAGSDAELRRRYDRAPERFERGERRVLEVVRIAAEEGSLEDAYAAAAAIARIWNPEGPMHQRNRAEIWGPLSEDVLAAYTSPEIARTAFALHFGSLSAPLLLASTLGRAPRVEYAVLRLHALEPAGTVSFAEARETLLEEAVRTAPVTTRESIRARILRQAQLTTAPALLTCPMQPLPIEQAVPLSAPPAATTDSSGRRPSVWGAPRIDRRSAP